MHNVKEGDKLSQFSTLFQEFTNGAKPSSIEKEGIIKEITGDPEDTAIDVIYIYSDSNWFLYSPNFELTPKKLMIKNAKKMKSVLDEKCIYINTFKNIFKMYLELAFSFEDITFSWADKGDGYERPIKKFKSNQITNGVKRLINITRFIPDYPVYSFLNELDTDIYAYKGEVLFYFEKLNMIAFPRYNDIVSTYFEYSYNETKRFYQTGIKRTLLKRFSDYPILDINDASGLPPEKEYSELYEFATIVLNVGTGTVAIPRNMEELIDVGTFYARNIENRNPREPGSYFVEYIYISLKSLLKAKTFLNTGKFSIIYDAMHGRVVASCQGMSYVLKGSLYLVASGSNEDEDEDEEENEFEEIFEECSLSEYLNTIYES